MPRERTVDLLDSTAACVVWFNPKQDANENVDRYAKKFNTVYVIDNSRESHKDPLPNNVVYVWLKRNRGIAFALNRGYELAACDGFAWLLTMDQDSKFALSEIDNLICALADELSHNSRVGIFAPCFGIAPPADRTLRTQLPHVLTSGNIVRILALADISGWDSSLFIDHVDHDLCFRLRKKGYEIVRSNRSWLQHKPGSVHIRYRRMRFSHSPRRYYFMSRNLVFLTFRYFFEFPYDVNRLWYYHAKNIYRAVLRDPKSFQVIVASLVGLSSGLLLSFSGQRHAFYQD